ncbi:SRPBCC family protein [Marinobacter panjinensis]|uniref:SRPBCC family protein n=1 Tax=Marinobacter panjinensis TaxID=2576384 RepID=A0A4U6QVT4_9GAMM|nr:SRPBCC family protein [Marinobacter panjinensis]MCR8915121.1 SRPBCC family protein [Marinobacter panjinensis]TKV64352.1 SRPBCC family protein [Marinobacter panjinensis]
MATYTIEIDETFEVPRHRVFALFADHERFGKLLGAPVKRIRDSDQADPNGVGSIRKIGIGPIGLKETVITFEPGSLIEYTITSMSPIRNHLGRIRFEDAANGRTRVQYTISFEDIVPHTGKLVSSALDQAIRKGIRRVPRLA